MPVPAAAPPDPASQIAGLVFALLLLDATGRIAQLNPAAEELLGAGATRLVGRRFLDAVRIADERVSRRIAWPDAGLTARGLDVELPDGQCRSVNLTLSPLAGRPGWHVVTLSDIGQTDMAEMGGDGALAAPAILAHEIKNPLSAIRGASQLLARKLADGDASLAALITGEVDRIARLVDRMQSLGSQTGDPLEPVNLHEVLRAALIVARSAGERSGETAVEFAEEFDPSLPDVLASRDRLQQVLINLLANARDAVTGREGGRVTVTTRFSSGRIMNALRLGRSVRLPIEITVSDNGPGIAPALRDRVFDPFVTSKKGGQGLGLALVRKLVRDMDGRIAHSRDEREGLTHFRIHLAIAQAGAS